MTSAKTRSSLPPLALHSFQATNKWSNVEFTVYKQYLVSTDYLRGGEVVCQLLVHKTPWSVRANPTAAFTTMKAGAGDPNAS